MSTSVNTTQASVSLEVSGPSGVRLVSAASIWGLAFCGALLCACSQRTASAEQPPTMSGEPASKGMAAKGGLSAPSTTTDQAEDDAELRRGYGLVDMRFDSCVKRENDYTVLGEGCPAGFLIYGPYVPVPASSEIEVSFEVKASKAVSVYADIVSQMGVQTLAGLNRQKVEPGVRQKVGYRVHIFNADVNVESRVGMDAEPGTSFEVTNLIMTVR